MVVVCGHNMGDIFRRNALNLGLDVVQSPRGGRGRARRRRVHVRPVTRVARRTRRRSKTYEPVPLTAKEDEIRRTRRHLRRRPARVPRHRCRRRSHARVARRGDSRAAMTTTEQIVWAHRVDQDAQVVRRGARCASTPTCCRPPTAPRRSPSTPSIRSPAADAIPAPGRDRQRPLRLHRREPTTRSRRDRAAVRRAARHRAAVLRDAGRRHLPFLFSRAGAGASRPVHSRRRFAQSRATARTARSASGSARPRSVSDGRRATCTSRSRARAASCSPGRCSPG